MMQKNWTFTIVLCFLTFIFQNCNKQTLNNGSINVALDLRSLEYSALQTPGNSVKITDLGIAGLYVTRVDLVNFTVYDLFNPNINGVDPAGNLCALKLRPANQTLTDLCNAIIYSTVDNQISVPVNNTVTPAPLKSYPYTYISEPDREILYIQ